MLVMHCFTHVAPSNAPQCRQAKAEYEGELKLRSMNDDHVGAMEWDWVWSMLQNKHSASSLSLDAQLLQKPQVR